MKNREIKEKVVLFPFTAKYLPLIRQQEKTNLDFILVPLLPPYLLNSYAIYGVDLSYLDYGQNTYTNLYDRTDTYNNYYFLDCDNAALYEFGKRFIKDHKISTNTITINNNLKHSEIYQRDKSFTDHFAIGQQIVPASIKLPNRLCTSRCKIICVFSVAGNNNKQEVCCELYNYYSKSYKTICLMTDEVYRYLGFYYFDYENVIVKSTDEFILTFNHYVDFIQRKESAEIIIIEIPGDILRYNSKIINGSGYQSYLVSRSISIDIGVCCVPLTKYEYPYYYTLAEYINRTFNIPSVFFHTSNYCVAEQLSNIENKLFEYPIERQHYEETRRKINSKEKILYDFRKANEIFEALLAVE